MLTNVRHRVSRTGGRIERNFYITPIKLSRDGQSRKMPRRGAVIEEKYGVTQDSRSTLPSNIGPFTPARCPRRISIGERRTETKLTEFMRRRCYKEISQRNLRRIGTIMKFLRNFSELIIVHERKFSTKLGPGIFNIKKVIFLRITFTHRYYLYIACAYRM